MTLRMWALFVGLIVAGLFALDAVNAATVTGNKSAKVSSSAKKAKKKKSAKAVGAKAASAKKSSGSHSDLQTDVKFDDSVLHGQYQTPEEALARVENEKGLSDLLGVRKHFKDRLATASEQE